MARQFSKLKPSTLDKKLYGIYEKCALVVMLREAGYSLLEIGDFIGVSKERVRQIENKGRVYIDTYGKPNKQ